MSDSSLLARWLPRFGRAIERRLQAGGSQPIAEIMRENAFAPYRTRILLPMAAFGALAFLPLALAHAAAGRLWLGGLLAIVALMLGIDAVAMGRGRRPPIPFAALMLPGLATAAIGFATQGIHGALWTYPAVLFGYFALSRRQATLMSVVMLAMGTALLAVYQEPATALRFALSLGLCLITTNIILDVLDSMQERLLEQSVTDPLTGAFNRRHLEVCLQHVIERRRRTGATATIVVVDVDRFRHFNERFGLRAGDAVLQSLAVLLRQRARKLDLVFRSGGEKFLLLLPDTRAADAMVLAEHLRAAVAQADFAEGRRLTASLGVCELAPDDGVEGWMKRAEAALRRAKDEGRDRVMD